jgi:hypothetical protein
MSSIASSSTRAPGGPGWATLGANLAAPAGQEAPDVLYSTIQHFTDRAKSLVGRPAGYFSLGPVAQGAPSSIPPSAPSVTQRKPQTKALTRPNAAVSHDAINGAPIDGVTGMSSFSTTKVRSAPMPRIQNASDGLQNFASGGLQSWGYVDPLNAQAISRAMDQAKKGAAQPTRDPSAAVASTGTAHKYVPHAVAAGLLLLAVL